MGFFMIENDTVKLLRECDAGIKMGVKSIDGVLDYVKNRDFKNELSSCLKEHDRLKEETQVLLDKYHDDGKNPNVMAKSMSWLKTNMKLSLDASDHMIADIMTDGCNMGVKSLSRYLNQYAAADEVSKDITKKLIKLEEELAVNIRGYL